ncbi:glucan endo-1,3-beta-glucosidase 4-like [Zingiber officinale]|uniref:glucan endo-1,3-beta-glucosidase 4-like n=1 Tax=Zingiber officinale TaxID=94328 RepID=UPI001C4C1F6A|nr:glucan endo-1,3-beta-glucosidase 4-like [Zingiber officinale]XP_042445712.1 glucan endo-1,3-beta-glucosidase 4-like [Zingiber officinale]XP_042445713.1 glucan endo-1,3-beta-glucosidase 4-like [Zingiber officinale]
MSHKRWLSQIWALVFILSDLFETAINAQYCVARAGADTTALTSGLNWACGPGGANCSPIQPGQACYVANNLTAIASYAYNDYYQKSRATGGTCNFSNTATLTPNNPSFGNCIFSGSGGTNTSNGTGTPTSPSPTLTPTAFGPPTPDAFVPFSDATSISSARSVAYLLPLICHFLL